MSKVRVFGFRGHKVVALQEFGFDRSELQPEHDQWINDARNNFPGGRIWLVGSADSPGTNSYNATLSMRRALTVQRALRNSPRIDSTFEVDNIGERLAPPSGRDPASRTVFVIFRNRSPEPPPPPSIMPWFYPQPTTEFFIRTARWQGLSVGARGVAISGSVMTMEVSDGLWSSYYEVEIIELRAGEEGGFSVPLPGNTTLRGTSAMIPGGWGWFRTQTPKTVTQFGRKPTKIEIANGKLGFRTIFDRSVLHWPNFQVPDSVSFPLTSHTLGESQTRPTSRTARSTAENLPLRTLNRLRQSMRSHPNVHTYSSNTYWTRN